MRLTGRSQEAQLQAAVCLVAKVVKTAADHAIDEQGTACSGCRCSLAGALRVLPGVPPSFEVRHLQMWKVILVEGFMFSPPAYSYGFSYGPVD